MAVMQSVGTVQQLLAVSSLECSDCHSATAARPGHCWKSRVSQRVPCKQRQSSTHGVSCHQHPGTAGPAHPGHPRVSFETFSQPAWLHTRIPVIQPQPATCACLNYSYRGHSLSQCSSADWPKQFTNRTYTVWQIDTVLFVFLAVLSTLYTLQVFSDTFYSIYCLVIKVGRSRSRELVTTQILDRGVGGFSAAALVWAGTIF